MKTTTFSITAFAATFGILSISALHGQDPAPARNHLDKILEKPPFNPDEVEGLDLTGPDGEPDGIVDVRDLAVFLNGEPTYAYFDTAESIVYHTDGTAALTVKFTKPIEGTVRFSVEEPGDPAPETAPPGWQPDFTVVQSEITLNGELSTQILIQFPEEWRERGGERVVVIQLRRPPAGAEVVPVVGEVNFTTHVLRVREFDEAEYTGTLTFNGGAGLPAMAVRLGLWKANEGAGSGILSFSSETEILGEEIPFSYQGMSDEYPVFNHASSGIPVTLDGALLNRKNGVTPVPLHGHIKLSRLDAIPPDDPLTDFLAGFDGEQTPVIYAVDMMIHDLLAAGGLQENPFSVRFPGRLSLQKVVYEELPPVQP